MKPILFNTEMVRAILDGRKTVTRRVIKPQPFYVNNSGRWVWNIPKNKTIPNCCTSVCTASREWWEYLLESQFPYSVGDILYVRETWNSDWCDHAIYRADGGSAKYAGYTKEPKWRPSIHMPKEAARIFLRVTDVRVERLQEITADGVEKEGFTGHVCPKDFFAETWSEIYDPRGCGWNANPWVWVIEFERCERPEED
jgi:hypothetical protein